MAPKYIRVRELTSSPARNGHPAREGLLPVSTATIWRWVKIGQFPKPVALGPQVTAWPLDVVEQWQRERSAR